MAEEVNPDIQNADTEDSIRERVAQAEADLANQRVTGSYKVILPVAVELFIEDGYDQRELDDKPKRKPNHIPDGLGSMV